MNTPSLLSQDSLPTTSLQRRGAIKRPSGRRPSNASTQSSTSGAQTHPQMVASQTSEPDNRIRTPFPATTSYDDDFEPSTSGLLDIARLSVDSRASFGSSFSSSSSIGLRTPPPVVAELPVSIQSYELPPLAISTISTSTPRDSQRRVEACPSISVKGGFTTPPEPGPSTPRISTQRSDTPALPLSPKSPISAVSLYSQHSAEQEIYDAKGAQQAKSRVAEALGARRVYRRDTSQSVASNWSEESSPWWNRYTRFQSWEEDQARAMASGRVDEEDEW